MRGRRIGWMFAVVLAIGSHTATAAGDERQPFTGGANLLALTGGTLLVWSSVGRASLRTAAGSWTDGKDLSVHPVWDVQPDGAGFLAAGSTDSHGEMIKLFDADAHETDRWEVPESVFELFTTEHGRWAGAKAGLIPLLPGGRLGPLELYPDDVYGRHHLPPRVFERDGKRVFCHGADVSESRFAPARCQPEGGALWTVRWASSEPPLDCGRWIIVRVGRDQKSLEVRSFDGRVAGHRRYSSVPAIACAGPATVAVGAGGVQIAALPSLATRWSRQVGQRRIDSIAALPGAVAYTVEGSGEVVVAPR